MIIAAALMAQRQLKNAIESNIKAITFFCIDDSEARSIILRSALTTFPTTKGFFNHRTSYCIVLPEAIDAELEYIHGK